MLPLEAKARWSANWSKPTLLKVAGLEEFAAGVFPLERMLLDLRAPEAASSSSLCDLPWAGYMVNEDSASQYSRSEVALLGDQAVIRPGDVVEIR
ncbi:His-Xaa-Ser system radical SAM maturase HxsC, partial [Lysobacter sp. 2RAB21]